MIVFDEAETGFWDRFFGALIAFFFTTITLICGLILIVAKFFAKGAIFKYYATQGMLFSYFTTPVFVWMALIALLSILYGAYLGSLRTIIMLGHMWGTSEDEGMALRIWLVIFIGAIIGITLMAFL